ncbi:hypothetical protein B1A75_11640 [Geobacillus sp. LEMMY01]|nr:hypothetical protein B1A75_11640 [Geobacillus sp. LEMMY01]
MELLKDSAGHPTISIGIVVCPSDGNTSKKLSLHADQVFMRQRVSATIIRFMAGRFEGLSRRLYMIRRC